MNIENFTNLLSKVNNEEQLTFDELAALSGIGSMKFLLRDWRSTVGWSTSDMPNFKHMNQFELEVKAFASQRNLTYESVQCSIKEAITSSFYTPIPVIDAILSSVKNLEAITTPYVDILEPSAGTGRFVKELHAHFKSANITAIEKEPLSAALAKSCFQNLSNVKVLNNIYENAPYDRQYDFIVSNIPFAAEPVNDPNMRSGYKQFQDTVHGFYFAKSLELLKPGGVICFLTTTGIMDNDSHKLLREIIVGSTDLISAVRLPDNVFKSENTKVTTDVILLRKPLTSKRRLSRQEELFAQSSTSFPSVENAIINPYYNVFKNNILGEVVVGNQYSNTSGISVVGNSFDDTVDSISEIFTNSINLYVQQANLRKVVAPAVNTQQSLFGDLFGGIQTQVIPAPITRPSSIQIIDTNDRPGNIISFQDQPNVYVSLGSRISFDTEEYYVKYLSENEIIPGKYPNKGELINLLIDLRRGVKNVLAAKVSENSNIKEGQQALVDSYDKFIRLSGGVSLTTFLQKANFNDVDCCLLTGLELVNPQTKEVVKSDILQPDYCEERVFETDDIATAILHCYNKKGYIDEHFIADLIGKPTEFVIKEALSMALVRFDPIAEHPLCLPHIFRSGRVVDKIAKLNNMLSGDRPEYLSVDLIMWHIGELESVKPQFVPIANIQPQLGEIMFDENIYRDFFAQYVGVEPDSIVIRRTSEITKVLLRPSAVNSVNKKLSIDTIAHTNFLGVDMIEAILNNKQVYFSYNKEAYAKPVYVADHVANSEFARKKEDILNHWQNYTANNQVVKDHIERVYNNMNSVVPVIANGSYLDFSELEKIGITPRDFQRNGISHVIENNGGLIDHPTGAGKTIVQAVAAIKLKRMGIVNKPLIAGIIANVETISRQIKDIYPDARVLFADSKSYAAKNRKNFFAQIANNDWDVIVMSHSQFESVPLNKEGHIAVINEEISNIRANIALLKEVDSSVLEQHLTKQQIKGMNKRIRTLTTELDKVVNKTDNVDLDIIKMGIDHIIIDEAHLFKNLQYSTRHTRISGLSNSKSERATKLHIHLNAIRRHFYNGADCGFTFVSATPLVNSMAEIYTLFRLIRPSFLRELNVQNFDAFIQTFAKFESDLEITVTGGYSYKTRCREFVKMDLLMKYYNQMAHVVSPQEVNSEVKLPTKHVHHINVERTAEQEQYLYDLIQFAENGDSSLIQRVEKTADGAEMLMVSTRSNLASIDMRLIDSDVYADFCTENKNTKLNEVCKTVARIYVEENHMNGAQLIFSDQGTPKDDDSIFNVYDAIKDILVTQYNIPSKEIAFIHDCNDDAQRRKLEDMVNKGERRIVIGSTQKLGTGVNMQKRLKAIHNLDIPWRPIDFEQRTGRIERQGNMYSDIDIFFYTTEKTLDAFRFGILEHKQKFINQVKHYNQFEGGSIQDVFADGDDVRYVDMVAEITGNPYVKQLAVAEREQQTLMAEYRHALNEKNSIRQGLWGLTESLKMNEVKQEKITQAKTIVDGYIHEGEENSLRYVLPNGGELDPNTFGEFILNYKKSGSIRHLKDVVATINSGHNKVAEVYCCYNGVEMNYNLRIGIYNNTQDGIIFETSYNKGAITSNPETVGQNPIKALKNLGVAQTWIDNQCNDNRNRIEELQGKAALFTEEHIDNLREGTVKLSSTIRGLRTKIESEKGTFIDETTRIRYADIKETTFTQAKQNKGGTRSVESILRIDL